MEGAVPQAQQGKTEKAQKGGYDLTSPMGGENSLGGGWEGIFTQKVQF